MEQHGKQALHAMVGGGDQIYNDEVFSGPQMQEWLKSGRKVCHPYSANSSQLIKLTSTELGFKGKLRF